MDLGSDLRNFQNLKQKKINDEKYKTATATEQVSEVGFLHIIRLSD